MRPPAEITDARRVTLVTYLVKMRNKEDIAELDSAYNVRTVHKHIARLREIGVKVTAVQKYKGRGVEYKLDMPLADALAIIAPAKTEAEIIADEKRKTDERRKIGRKVQRKKEAEYRGIGDFHPWWGIICTPQTIDIGVPSCK